MTASTVPAPLSQWLLAQLSEGALPSVVAAPLHRRVRRSRSWSAHYHLQRQIERGVGVSETPAPLSSGQKDLLKRLILDDPRLQAQASPATTPLSAGALAAACAGALVLVAQPAPVDDGVGGGVVDFATRGDQHSQLRLRVRCVVDGAVSDDVEARADDVTLACADGALLAIAVTSTSDASHDVAVEVVDADGIASRFVDVAVAAGASNVLVPTGLRLEGDGERRVRLVDAKTGAVRSADVIVRVTTGAAR
ncbi:MAG TPA: hypothetical protein VGF99_12240 [Myxococcota bacterium]